MQIRVLSLAIGGSNFKLANGQAAMITHNLLDRIPSWGRRVTIFLWGESFGRPFDTEHEIVSIESEGRDWEIRFKSGHALQIFNAAPPDLKQNGVTFPTAERLEFSYKSGQRMGSQLLFEERTWKLFATPNGEVSSNDAHTEQSGARIFRTAKPAVLLAAFYSKPPVD